MSILFQLIIILVFSSTINAQNKLAYKIFDSKGNMLTYSSMLDNLRNNADVVLIGELHNNTIVHWLEIELAPDLNTYNSLILGAAILQKDI